MVAGLNLNNTVNNPKINNDLSSKPFNTNNNVESQTKPSELSRIPAGTFNHYAYKPSFCGISPNAVIKPVNYVDKYSFEALKKVLANFDPDLNKAAEKLFKSAVEKGVELGEGKQHKVFSIPETTKFVIRIGKDKRTLEGTLEENKDILFKELNLGQPVAYIKTADNIVMQVLRKVKGTSIGVPYMIRKEARDLRTIIGSKLIGEDAFIKNNKTIAKIPQQAFDELANTVKTLRNSDYVFDISNPNNILLNKDKLGQFHFNVIDDLLKISDIEYMYQKSAWKGTVEDLAIPLMDYSANDVYCKFSPNIANNIKLKEEIQNNNKDILEKCIFASMKASLPRPKNHIAMTELFKTAGMDGSIWRKIEYNWDKIKVDVNAGKEIDIFNPDYMPLPFKL